MIKHPVKIRFKNYPDGNWEDWSKYLVSAPDITLKIESEKPGQAGVIVYDDTKVSFYNAPGNPVHKAFNKDLTNVQRYLYEISIAKSDGTFAKRLEGISNFQDLSWTKNSKKINFEIVDKLSALNSIAKNPKSKTTFSDIYPGVGFDFHCWAGDPEDEEKAKNHHKWVQVTAFTDNEDPTPLDAKMILNNKPEIGSIIQSPFNKEKLSLVVFKGKDENGSVYLDLLSMDGSYPKTKTKTGHSTKESPLEIYDNHFFNQDVFIKEHNTSYRLTGYNNAGELQTKTLEAGYSLKAIDGIKMIHSIVKNQWPDIELLNRSGVAEFPIPLDYFEQIIESSGFNETPLKALSLLSKTMHCYVFINSAGKLVIQYKEHLGVNGTTRTTDSLLKDFSTRKLFWDKLSDNVSVKIQGWTKDSEGNEINGYSSLSKNKDISPRNSIDIEVLTTNSNAKTKEELDTEAYQVARREMEFYGKRHESYDYQFDMTDDTLEWELLDNIILNLQKYFFTKLKYKTKSRVVSAELVSTKTWDYDLRQVAIKKSDNEKSYSRSYSGGGSSGSGSGGSISGVKFLMPLKKEGDFLKLKYSDNFKVKTFGEERKLDLADNIGIGISPDAVHALKIKGKSFLDGDVKIKGNLTVCGTIDQENRVDLQVKDKIIALNRDGTNTTADGAGVEILGTSNIAISSIKYIGSSWNFSHDVNLPYGKNIKVNNTSVLNYTALGNTVTQSSLQKVGVVTSGQWKATQIEAAYIKYNPVHFTNSNGFLTPESISVESDFGVTGNVFNLGGTVKINTPQDLRVSAAPTFSGLNLLGNTIITGNRYIKNNFSSGIFGEGWIIDLNNSHGSSPYKGSYIEVDNARIRDVFVTHIFKKDIIRAVNSQVFITDSAVVGRESNSYLYIKQGSLNATFNVGWVIESRDVDNNGNIKSVKGTITGQSTQFISGVNYNRYTLSFSRGHYSYFKAGATVIRRSGSRILLTATNNQKPYIRCYTGNSDSVVTTGIGNLDGIYDPELNPNGDGLYGTNAFLKGKIIATSGKIGGCTLDGNSMWIGGGHTKNYKNNLIIGNIEGNGNVWHNGVLFGKYADGTKQLRFSKNNSTGNTYINIQQDSEYTFMGIGGHNVWNVQLGDLKVFNSSRPNVRGIAIINSSGKELLRVDSGGTAKLAGFNFSDRGFLISNGSTGIELTLNSTTSISKGFAVFNPSNTKVKCGDAISGWDWNITTPNKLTVKGNVSAGKFSTTYHWNGDAEGIYTIIDTGWLKQQNNAFNYTTRSSLTQGVLLHTSHKNRIQKASAQIGVRNDTGIAYIQLADPSGILEMYNDQIKFKGLPVLKERYRNSIPLITSTSVYALKEKINELINALTYHGLIQQ